MDFCAGLALGPMGDYTTLAVARVDVSDQVLFYSVAEERPLANFVDFIGEGRSSRTLAQALVETERKVETLKGRP